MDNIRKVYIYCLKDPDTKEIRYIGQTVNLKNRYFGHITYFTGYDHKTNWIKSLIKNNKSPLMEELTYVNEDKVDILEIELIKHYKQFCKLTNTSEGGKGRRGYKISEEHREIIKRRMLGENNPGKKQSKAILQYTLNNEFVKEYSSVIKAAKENNLSRSGVTRAARKIIKTCGGFKWELNTKNK